MPGAAPYPGAAPLRPPRFNPSPAGPGRPVKPRGGGTRRGGRAHPRGTRTPAGDKRGQRGDKGRRRGWAVPAAGAGHGGGPTRDAGTREWARREWGWGGRTAEEPPWDLGTRRGGPGEVGGDVPSAGHGGTAGRGGSGGGLAPSPRPRGTVALSAVPERALSAVPAWALGGSCATRVSRVRVSPPLPPSIPPSVGCQRPHGWGGARVAVPGCGGTIWHPPCLRCRLRRGSRRAKYHKLERQTLAGSGGRRGRHGADSGAAIRSLSPPPNWVSPPPNCVPLPKFPSAAPTVSPVPQGAGHPVVPRVVPVL